MKSGAVDASMPWQVGSIGARRAARGKRRLGSMRLAGAVPGIALLLLLVACGQPASLPSNQAAASNATTTATAATVAAQAIDAAAPVRVDVAATTGEGGAAQAHHLLMMVRVTVMNRTSAPIHLIESCPTPAVVLVVRGVNVVYSYDTYGRAFCATVSAVDAQPAIDPSTSHTWSFTISTGTDPQSGEPQELAPGSYTVTALVHYWHQDSLEHAEADPSIPQGSAMGQITLTI